MSYHLIPASELTPSPSRTIEFQAGEYGAPVSIILVDSDTGKGPSLHTHPYPETWIVRSGRALMNVDGETIEAGSGDAIVIGPNTPHGFKNPGPDRLQMVCVHAAGRFETVWLDQTS
jgi:mannose-6-phosphate isomerase-like protein (cupin superfamily)